MAIMEDKLGHPLLLECPLISNQIYWKSLPSVADADAETFEELGVPMTEWNIDEVGPKRQMLMPEVHKVTFPQCNCLDLRRLPPRFPMCLRVGIRKVKNDKKGVRLSVSRLTSARVAVCIQKKRIPGKDS